MTTGGDGLAWDKAALEFKLLPESLMNTLMRASTLLTGWEFIRSDIIEGVKGFFIIGFDEDGYIYDEGYQRDVESKVGKGTMTLFDASVAWLVEMEALTDADVGLLREVCDHRNEVAHRKLHDCDQRLAKYRQALEAGAEPTVVAGWMAEVQTERVRAEAELVAATPHEPMSKDEVRKLVLEARDIASVLADADAGLKADLYTELGVQISYDPFQRIITATAGPCTKVRVGGGT